MSDRCRRAAGAERDERAGQPVEIAREARRRATMPGPNVNRQPRERGNARARERRQGSTDEAEQPATTRRQRRMTGAEIVT